MLIEKNTEPSDETNAASEPTNENTEVTIESTETVEVEVVEEESVSVEVSSDTDEKILPENLKKAKMAALELILIREQAELEARKKELEIERVTRENEEMALRMGQEAADRARRNAMKAVMAQRREAQREEIAKSMAESEARGIHYQLEKKAAIEAEKAAEELRRQVEANLADLQKIADEKQQKAEKAAEEAKEIVEMTSYELGRAQLAVTQSIAKSKKIIDPNSKNWKK